MSDPEEAPTPQSRIARTWRRYLRFWGPRVEADVDDELQFHFDMRVRDYVTRGMTEAEARAAARRRLGDLDAAREECMTIDARQERRVERSRIVDALLQDLRYAFRTLGRQSGWTAVAVLTLALGIGANTAVFSVVNNLLLHPLPYPHADRVVVVMQQPSEGNTTGIQVMITPLPKLVRAWRDNARSLEEVESYSTTDMTLQPPPRAGTPAIVQAAAVLPTFPRFAGQQPILGRVFSTRDIADGARVVMLGEAIWRQRYGSDARVIGSTIILDDAPYTVIGVMPAAFRLPRIMESATDVWLPLDLRKDDTRLVTMARLRPGVPYQAATRELDAIAARTESSSGTRSRFITNLQPPSQFVSFRQSLVMLAGAVALVLLIACANVAHLLLARGATRQRELAIRAAVGAGRSRLFRQLLTESLLLASAGCVAGVSVGWVGLHALVAARPQALVELTAARLDMTTLGVTIALSLLTGVGFGVIGATNATRYSTHQVLKSGALSASQSHGQGRLRSLLVVSEMALSTTLLVGAALLVRSVAHLRSVDPGFDPQALYTVRVSLPPARYSTTALRSAFFAELADRARHLSGVRAVTIAGAAPPMRSFTIGALQIEGRAPPPVGTTSFISTNGVEPDYFRVMRMKVLEGTPQTDTSAAAGQVLVNEGFARKYWGGISPLGKRLRILYNSKGQWLTVVGVVADAATGGLTQDATMPMLYTGPSGMYQPTAIVRTSGDANPLPALRALVWSIDPHLPPAEIANVESVMHDSISGVRFTMLLLTVLTSLAVVLAAVGLYGVMAYGVAQRTREIGIRIALGATRSEIGRAIVSEGVALAFAGVIAGLAGAYWATKLVEKLLYGIGRGDPVAFGTGAAVLLLTAVVACLVPMRRALAVDPLVAMRAE